MIPTMTEVQDGYYCEFCGVILPEPWDPSEDDASYVAQEARQEAGRDD